MMKRYLQLNILFWIVLYILSFCGCSKEEMVILPHNTADATYEPEVSANNDIVQIVVYVCGAVKEPGVVSLPENARVIDAIALAGGMTQEADKEYINLASLLADGEKVYIPTKGETALWEEEEARRALININTADKQTLCTLPGIGETKATDIIAYRENEGPFECIEDITKVAGIKDSLFVKIEKLITVDE